MKKIEVLLISILEEIFKGVYEFKQQELALKYKVSLGLVNKTMKTLAEIGVIEIKRIGIKILDVKKILIYACTKRNFYKDVIDSFYVDLPVKEIESSMPNDVVFTAYTAYRLLFNEAPSDYSEVYIYIDEKNKDKVRKRFKCENKRPNVFVLKKNFEIKKSTALIYADLWNLKEWYAKEFLNALHKKLEDEGILE